MDNPYKSNNSHSMGSNRDAWGNTFGQMGINNPRKSLNVGGSSISPSSYNHLMGKLQPAYLGSQSLSPSKDDDPLYNDGINM